MPQAKENNAENTRVDTLIDAVSVAMGDDRNLATDMLNVLLTMRTMRHHVSRSSFSEVKDKAFAVLEAEMADLQNEHKLSRGWKQKEA